jgi:hypothetical protein
MRVVALAQGIALRFSWWTKRLIRHVQSPILSGQLMHMISYTYSNLALRRDYLTLFNRQLTN